ncbi:hypothetical protein RI570_17800, partial [Brucella pseudogrignonensis]|uniref:hypothetical protein n=1 Tax=Brucella pseudogrignonensis TaxID=419475 RepID=UPI0028B2DDD9
GGEEDPNPLPRGKWKFNRFYQWAGIIHRDIGKMTLWEFRCAVEGFKAANATEEKAAPGMSDDQLAELELRASDGD